MGLQSQVSDCSSQSIFILLVEIVANCACYLRSVFFPLLRSTGISPIEPDELDDGRMLGSGLSGLIVLSEQLNLNRVFSYSYDCGGGGGDGSSGSECVVCLSALREGEQVRRLACRHVFHKGCLDGWLEHFNFNCPLCRAPLVSGERVAGAERRVGHDLLTFFSYR